MSAAENKSFDFKLKVIVIGDAAVGKTSLVKNFTQGLSSFRTSTQATLGMDIYTVPLHINNTNETQLNLWDIGGGSMISDLRTTFYPGARGFLAVLDVTRFETFEHLSAWIAEVEKVVKKKLPGNVLANKCDLEDMRAVQYKDIEAFARARDLTFYRTSALTGENVNESFMWLARKIHKALSASKSNPAM